MTDEWAIIKLGLKTGVGSSHGKSVQATIRFVIQPVILHSVYDSLDRLRVNERLVYKKGSYKKWKVEFKNIFDGNKIFQEHFLLQRTLNSLH